MTTSRADAEFRKGTRVAEEQEFQETFALRRSSQAACTSLDIAIMSYRGPMDQPIWMDSERGTSLSRRMHVV